MSATDNSSTPMSGTGASSPAPSPYIWMSRSRKSTGTPTPSLASSIETLSTVSVPATPNNTDAEDSDLDFDVKSITSDTPSTIFSDDDLQSTSLCATPLGSALRCKPRLFRGRDRR
ncbi:uncharacterized protein BDW43DRAFT_267107 [Aspergillus alliaceus]|uniref:uncharacterized protein n=1 Tax=Petromyces alliaceus TaxID=209559 RepID=UPI0012A5E9FC|nr:uncharacterized protein BDW43DRAFT_267107 [Aspergillus alliaceus]KAB8236508.1 hypothetical protein BDW43DRAFT_267107 [Aspergillus alliaceus]